MMRFVFEGRKVTAEQEDLEEQGGVGSISPKQAGRGSSTGMRPAEQHRGREGGREKGDEEACEGT